MKGFLFLITSANQQTPKGAIVILTLFRPDSIHTVPFKLNKQTQREKVQKTPKMSCCYPKTTNKIHTNNFKVFKSKFIIIIVSYQ